MPSWLQQQTSSPLVQFSAATIAGALLAAGSIFLAQNVQRQLAVQDLKAEIPKSDDEPNVKAVSLGQRRLHLLVI